MVDISEISDTLKVGLYGIYFSDRRENVSFPEDGHQTYARVEDLSFWFKHRNKCIISAVTNFPPPNNGTIFDIGGGNGFVSLGLKEQGFNVALIEPGLQGAIVAKRRGIDTVICATTNSAKIRPESLPAVGLFDVIEHIENDSSFLASISTLLKSNGKLYLTVPAYNALWSHEDHIAGHYRRYSLKEIESVIKEAGFYVDFSSYFFRPLPLPIFFLRSLPFKFGIKTASSVTDIQNDHKIHPNLSLRVINRLLSSEIASIHHKRKMNFGASCLIVARKVEK